MAKLMSPLKMMSYRNCIMMAIISVIIITKSDLMTANLATPTAAGVETATKKWGGGGKT